ncbi:MULTISPECIES: hypothetical protein [Aeromonas]|uniref:hypothetical protein n=1 Tax=Aeromonas TaxID=642 RepID=UPI0011B93D4A|nr:MULTISPECIES: hypothetical protein [Aeromonas]MDU4190649.1 hypothetical protein [Aeromonas sp.]
MSPLFAALSAEFGYNASDYVDEIDDLMQLWQGQLAVEIYRDNASRRYGRIKPSGEGCEPGSVPYLLDLYHARLLKNGANDPLVVIDFQPVAGADDTVTLRFLVDHNQMFGTLTEKAYPERLKALKRKVSAAAQQKAP